jgi:hypothetical protein
MDAAIAAYIENSTVIINFFNNNKFNFIVKYFVTNVTYIDQIFAIRK